MAAAMTETARTAVPPLQAQTPSAPARPSPLHTRTPSVASSQFSTPPGSTTPVTSPPHSHLYSNSSPKPPPPGGDSHWNGRPTSSPLSATPDVFYTSGVSGIGNTHKVSTPPMASSAANGGSFGLPAGHALNSPSAIPSRRLSLDTRRVRSDIHPQRHMSITMGKRPSVVTGGYESSSEEDDTETPNERGPNARSMWHGDDGINGGASRASRGMSISALNSGHGAGSAHGGSTPTTPGLMSMRHRAHAASPHSHQTTHGHGAHGGATPTVASPLSPATLQGLGLMNSSHTSASGPLIGGRRRAQSLITPSTDFSPPLASTRRASRHLRPPLTSAHTPRTVTTSSGIPSPGGSERPATSRVPSESVQSRSASMRSVRSYGDHDQLAVPSHSREGSIREASSRKHKHHRDSPRKQRAFGTSLGLGAAPREAVLSADQIQDLLSDVDVSSAMQRMSAAPLPRRMSTNVRDLSPSRRDSMAPMAPQTLSPPSQTLELPSSSLSPPRINKPYLVSAPPALTSGDWSGRARTESNASSTEPPFSISSRNATPMTNSGSRIRTSSLTAVPDNDEEPMTFDGPAVSPIPAGESDEEFSFNVPDTSHDLQQSTATVASGTNSNAAASPPSSIIMHRKESSGNSRKDSTGRRRISGLFGSIRRKRDSSPPPQLVKRTSSPAPQPTAEKAREQEMRVAEQERREEELAQEKMYRAVVQVRSHPASQRRAQRAALYLDGYYAAIHEGLEHPPKFNPLAVLRWIKMNDDQKLAKAKWEAEMEVASRASGSLTGLSRSDASVNSPQSEAFRMSLDTMRRGLSPHGSRSGASATGLVVAPGWHYTLDDVANYTACGGKVDFFIPPIPSIPDPPPSMPTSPGLGDSAMSYGQMQGGERRESLAFSTDEYEPNMTTRDENLSMSLSSQPGVHHAIAADSSMEDGGMANLSRASSFDINRSLNSLRRPRGHQSSPSGPTPQSAKPSSSLQVLRGPLEKFGRRNISLSVSPQAAAAAAGIDDTDPSRRPGWLTADAPNPELSQSLPTYSHSLKDRVRRGFNTVANGRNENVPPGSDDEHHRLRRKLFSRGGRHRNGHMPTDSTTSRVEAMRALEDIVGHERQLRYEVTDSRQPTEREIKAQAGLKVLETQIYEERAVLLQHARQEVANVAATEHQMSTVIEQFLTSLDQAQATFNTAADVDVQFPNLEDLRRPKDTPTIAADDESADSLAPLRGEDSDRGGFSAGGTWSDGRSGRPTPRVQRKQSLVAPSLPNLGFVYGTFNRRSIVDPTLGEPMDPMRRAELSCDRAREAIEEMVAEREDTTRELQSMVETINQLIAQKDRVRKWTTRTLDQIAQLKDERDTLRLKIRGGIRPRMARFADSGIDLAARWILGIASVGFRLYRIVTGRGGESWLPWALFAGVLSAVLGYFYMVGEGADHNVATYQHTAQ